MSVLRDIDAWDVGTWVGVFLLVVVLCATLLFALGISFEQSCAEWAEGGDRHYDGKQLTDRYDLCMRERVQDPRPTP